MHNVFFNTHTVTGIVISVGLYVIFIAGAFALFQNNITNWELNTAAKELSPSLDYDEILRKIESEGFQMYGRDFRIDLREDHGTYIRVFSNPPKYQLSKDTISTLSYEDSLQYTKSIARFNYIIDPITYDLTPFNLRDNVNQKIGRLLTRLHYFQQIPVIGLFLSGFVSLFFLFAIVTGVITHWRKIISNFFTFRLKSSVKNLWTDAHTALGILGLPYQFMYAVTGALFGLGAIILPISTLTFGNPAKAAEILVPFIKSYELQGETNDRVPINPLVEEVLSEISKKEIQKFQMLIKSYGDENAHLDVIIDTETQDDFVGQAYAVYSLSDGSLVSKEQHTESSFKTASYNYFTKLHFGNFGGYLLKGTYFLLALLSCFVIITGVMVWLTARDKQTYAHRAKFNKNVGAIYLGACLGLYPAIVILFIIAKALPLAVDGRYQLINYIFFGFWLAYTIYAYFIKSPFKINTHALIVAGALGLLIPVLNGLQSGLWFWKSLGMGYSDSFFVDVSWLIMSVITLWIAYVVKPVSKKVPPLETPEEWPEDFKDDTIISNPVLNINSKAR
ncbi:MAG: PepSY-associated TM helix domain-containing protein [Bacteroidota bacterium]